MDLRELGEREAISRLRRSIGDTEDLGCGQDDCAAVLLDDGTVLLASTDLVLGTTHMLPGATPGLIGKFAVEIAVSDVAAMGGSPAGILCAYAMPPGTEIEWLSQVSGGMSQAATALDTAVLGGDTKRSPEPTISVTALGTVPMEECMFRRGAREGDALLLTGPVGGPAMGYCMERDPSGRLKDRALALVYEVRARVRAGRALATSGYAHACIDLSDGLAPCLSQLMEASGVGAELLWEQVPLAEGLEDLASTTGRDLREMALNWGGEYELLAAVDPEGVEPLVQVLGRLGLEATVVGRVHGARRQNIIISERGREVLNPHGFDHFQV